MKRRTAVLPGIAIHLVAAFLTGCAATRQDVRIASGPIAADSARIAVSRDQAFGGSACTIAIADNGRQIGETGSGGQLVWDRAAGCLELTAVNVELTTPARRGKPLRFRAGAGESYKVRVHFSFSVATPILELVSGTAVECEPVATSAVAVPAAAPPAPGADGTQTFTGRVDTIKGIAALSIGARWKIMVASDTGESTEFWVRREGLVVRGANGADMSVSDIKGKRVELTWAPAEARGWAHTKITVRLVTAIKVLEP